MSTSADIYTNGDSHEHILRPRAVKPPNPAVIRTISEEGLQPTIAVTDVLETGSATGSATGLTRPTNTNSGRSTPVPEDAPPSVQYISSARKQVRAEQRRRIFPTIEYASRVSHFDPNSDYRDFQGFYILFWIALTIMAITTMLRNIKDTGYPMRVEIWQLFTVKVWELALADALMVASTAISLPLHKLFRSTTGKKLGLRWAGGGMAIQSLYQVGWLAFWVSVPFLRDWTWTAQVFLLLHTLVLLMKMHSYAFYNGHLSETERRLRELDSPSTASKAPAYQYPSSAGHARSPSGNTDLTKSHADEVAQLREDLAIELTSPMGSVTYPRNLTWFNYVDYIFCPTLCYELEYPRTPGIVWTELGYKILATFGVIFLLTITSEEFILPVMVESAQRLESVTSFPETALILAESISMLLFPFMITFLLVFLVSQTVISILTGGTATSLFPSPCLLCLPSSHRPTSRHTHHLSHYNGMHYQKDPRLWIYGADEPVAHCDVAENKMGERKESAEQCLLLV
ncbi:MBOAT family protein [Rutstroemia sp. NJR-2017a BVV2]|nr:MBOAT family protein [Rutstroemia sp. NJR-2017a BVV2]